MKKLLFILNILICFSDLIDQVRIDIINIALLNLPKRENIDILKMGIEMSKSKDKYSMTDVEAAYFAYKWIAYNIEIDCLGVNHGNSSTSVVATYKNGKGGPSGISNLFNTISGLLNIESDTIYGLEKYVTWNYTQFIQFKEHAWNYILIDNNYYLLDATMGAGFCSSDNRFYKRSSDFYFGTKPERFIRSHFPNDNKMQLLSKTITKSEFKTMAYLYEDFYLLFNTMSPDISITKNTDEIRVRLTANNSVDDIFEDLEFTDMISITNEPTEIGIYMYVERVSRGLYEFNYTLYSPGRYDIFVENIKTKKSYSLMTFEVIE